MDSDVSLAALSSADSARKRVPEKIPGLLDETSRSRSHGAFVVSGVTNALPRGAAGDCELRALEVLQRLIEAPRREVQCRDAVGVSVSPRPRGTL